MPKNFAGQNLRGKSFKGQDLTGADFSGGVWLGGRDGVDRGADDHGKGGIAGLCIFA